MLTVSEYAAKHDITTQRVYQLIKENRLNVVIDKGVKLIKDKKLPQFKQLGRPKYRRN